MSRTLAAVMATSAQPSPQYFAHVCADEQAPDGWRIHDLGEHLRGVAELASEFVPGQFGDMLREFVYLAGLWHDLGKLSDAFQERIRGVSGYAAAMAAADEHLEAPGRVDHSTAGGLYALEQYGETPPGPLLAHMILAHHTGLQDADYIQERLEKGKAKRYLKNIRQRIAPEFVIQPVQKTPGSLRVERQALLARMLFSMLVDADFLDTARFMQPHRFEPPTFDLAELEAKLDRYLQSLSRDAQANQPGPVNTARNKILRHVQSLASLAPGFFTLTVPTGGGKTLVSLSFALKHAMQHQKRRIIYVIPYTSIIEQTARVFREVLGDDAVLEHHSNLDPLDYTRENPRSRIQAQNWDAPIIVTTNVQFFESLFGRRTSRVRKLHRIVDSVVIFDEAQMLPPDFLQPIVSTMRELVQAYGVTAVLCTATQPALASHQYGQNSFQGIDGATELAPEPQALFRVLERVQVHWPEEWHTTWSPGDGESALEDMWQNIAARIREHRQSLTIVNTRADARRLAQLLPDALHLSTNLCGAHRADRVTEIRQFLQTREALQVVSTQLIEAGVDLDFPVVFRALSGLDSIAQAAGRCNREGRLERGDVYVFVPPKKSPAGHLRHMEQATRLLMQNGPLELTPATFKEYFRQLYYTKASLDSNKIEEAERCMKFETVAEQFQLIPPTAAVLVPYGAKGRELLERICSGGDMDRRTLRQAQRYSVNVLERDLQLLIQAQSVETIDDRFHVLTNYDLYDDRFGLLLDDPRYHTNETLVC